MFVKNQSIFVGDKLEIVRYVIHLAQRRLRSSKIQYPSQILQTDSCNIYVLFTRTKTYGIDN
jgi:hypothetical protein